MSPRQDHSEEEHGAAVLASVGGDHDASGVDGGGRSRDEERPDPPAADERRHDSSPSTAVVVSRPLAQQPTAEDQPKTQQQQGRQQPTHQVGLLAQQQQIQPHQQQVLLTPELNALLVAQQQQQQQAAVLAAHLNAQQQLQAAQTQMQLAPFAGVHNLIPLHLQQQAGAAAATGGAGGVPVGQTLTVHNLIPGHLALQAQGGGGMGGHYGQPVNGHQHHHQQQPALIAADPRQYQQMQQQAQAQQQIQQMQQAQQMQIQTIPIGMPPAAPAPGLPPNLPLNPNTGLPFLTVQDMTAVLGPHGAAAPRYNGVDLTYPNLRVLNANPPVYAVDNFLTPTECDFLIKAAQDAFGPAPVVGRGVGEVSPSRTSSTCYLAREDLPGYLDKVTRLTGKPREHCELPQVGRYLPSQQYLQHFDAFDLSDQDGRRFASNGGQRTVTVLVYLNDVQNGGSTHFPALNLEVRPRRGTACVFFPATVDGLLDKMALHAALPAVDTKFVSQVWIRQGNYDGLPSKRIFPSEDVARQAAAALQQQQQQQQQPQNAGVHLGNGIGGPGQ